MEILDEAATRLSPEFRDARPEVPWRDIIGMRTILAHGYFDIDPEAVWRAVSVDVSNRRRSLRPN